MEARCFAPKFTVEATFQLYPSPKAFPAGHAGYFERKRQLLESSEFLEPLVGRLSLAERWKTTHGQAVKILTGTTSAEQLKGTDLMTLKVVHSDQSEALLIATGILNAFKKLEYDQARAEEMEELNRVLELIRDQKAKISKMESDSSISAAELEIERNNLEGVKLGALGTMSGGVSDGVIVHESPTIRRSTFWTRVRDFLQNLYRKFP